MPTAPPPMTDRNIIEVRKAQVGRYGTVDPTKPYADSIAFARAIIAARDAHWQATIAANPVERRVPSVVDLCAGPLHGFDDHCDPVAEPQAEAVQATTIAEAARDVGKWLNERPNRPIDLRHVAMLVAHTKQPQAEAVPLTHVLVPVDEPTDEMVDAACAAVDGLCRVDFVRAYVAAFAHLKAGYRDESYWCGWNAAIKFQQAEAVPSDVVRDAERYRWLRDQTTDDGIAIVMKNKCINDSISYAENINKHIDAAIAQQKGGV